MTRPSSGFGDWVTEVIWGPRALFCSLLSGVLVGLTFTPWGGPVLPFVAFAPVVLTLRASERRLTASVPSGGRTTGQPDAAPNRPRKPGAGLGPGFVVGFTAHAIGLYWMVPALAWRTGLAVPTYLMVLALVGIGSATAFEGALRLRHLSGWPLPVTLAICWVAFEWAAARVPGLPYAWLNVGGSLAWYPVMAAPASFFGGAALTAWTVVTAAVLGVALADGARPGWAQIRWLGLLLLPFSAWGMNRPDEESARPTSVIAVQSGHGGFDGGGPGGAGEGFRPWVDPVRRLVAGREPELVIFPERFLGRPPRPGLDGDAFAEAVGTPVLFGAPDLVENGPGEDSVWFNAAFLVTPGDREPQIIYKARLVPGLEDGGSPFASLLGLPTRGYRYGAEPKTLKGPEGPLGVLICYDSAFPDLARTLVDGGARLLIVVSNDDWMDPAGRERATWAYWQHETQARLRAVENRVPVVQVASTGFTFVVDRFGRRSTVGSASQDPRPFERVAVRLLVPPPGAPGWFTRTGDVMGLACFALWLCTLVPAGALARMRVGSSRG